MELNGSPKPKLSPKELAYELGVRQDTLMRWRQAKIGPPYYREVNRIFYYREEVETWRASTKWA